MLMPPVEQRRSNVCIWIIACHFLLFIVSGGVFLAMYIALPEPKDRAWYPVAGMVLVAIPRLFWLLTFMYRCCIKGDGDAPFLPKRPSSNMPRASKSMWDRPERTWPAAVEPQEEEEEDQHGRKEQGEWVKGGDSHHSHESVLPLALSMSMPS